MLMNGRKSISQICYETGFSSFQASIGCLNNLKRCPQKSTKKYFDLKQNFELV